MFKNVLVILFLISSTAFAQDHSAGSDSCGLGWQVTKKKTFSATSTRGTTNSVIPPTFGMTSGTMGCEQHGLVKADMKSLHFADANFENLMAEIAEGQGEYLTGFIQMMGCKPSLEVTSALQFNYSSISESATPGELVNKTKAIIRSNENACQV